jgi:molybdopterin-guanine dinucleotide biosynthesis protein A
LGGIETALAASGEEWNLVTACDMPGLTARVLEDGLARAHGSSADCVIPRSAGGRLEPLCAVWRRTCLHPVRLALDAGRHAIKDLLPHLNLDIWQPDGDLWHVNVNTPEDWAEHGRIEGAEHE